MSCQLNLKVGADNMDIFAVGNKLTEWHRFCLSIILLNGIKMKLAGDSSLHFVPLRMTDICVVEGEEEVGGKPPTSFSPILSLTRPVSF